jgi:hypothetical protein
MEIEIAKAKELLNKIIEKGDVAEKNIFKFEEHTDEIVNIIDKVLDVFGDGLQLNDVTRIGEIIEPAIKLAATFEDYAGEDKRQFVIELVNIVYRVVDTYPTGKENNINIPFVMGALERKIEHGILTFAAGMAVDAVYKKMKDNEEV